MRSARGEAQLSVGVMPTQGSRSLLLPTTWTVANITLCFVNITFSTNSG
jgi:hypothetical protein